MSDSSPSRVTDPPLTISSLLDSLHSHLQTQTELLPTLHAQLGLPQSALTDELSSLHQRLAACVEEQIDLRRQEVDKWMRKCDAIERECLKFTKALGGHTKVVSASVGELRKQQVLPVRHEMLNQYLEKLDHLYKAKVEQLTNLSNRILSLSSTLGAEFFSLDLTEPPPAYGESVSDNQAFRVVTPERFSKLEKELARGKGEINRRLQHLSATFLQMDWLYQELDIPPPSFDDEDLFSAPSTSSKPLSSRAPSRSLKPGDPFMSSTSSVSALATPTPCFRGSTVSLALEPGPVPDFRRIYINFLTRVDEAEAEGNSVESNPFIGLEGVQPTVELMEWAEHAKDELESVKKRREAHIQAMYDQLEALWKRLGVEDGDIDEFVENNRGSTEAVIKSYEEELERMLELKAERMGVFIGNARQEIEGLWDELMYGEEERAEFAPFTDDEHSEDLLTAHEEEVQRLKEERRRKAPILASIRKYFEICEGEKELAAAAQDQSRLLGRGPRDPGRLLREEKMRKRVSREKPRLESELLLSLAAWEETEGKPFLVNGARMLDVLESLGVTAQESSRAKPRAGSVPPRSTTPQVGMKRSVSRTTSSESESNPAKRARVVSTASGVARSRPVTRSVTKNEGKAIAPTRPPLGSSRTGNLNTNGRTGIGSGSGSVQKRTTRTPSGASVPRSGGSAAKNHPPISVSTVQKSTHGVRVIGLGHPSSLQRPSGRPMSSSATSGTTSCNTFALMGVTAVASRARGAVSTKKNGFSSPGKGKRTPGRTMPRSARNVRRESFRPRPSTVDQSSASEHPPSRFGGPFVFTLKEEEGY